MNLPAEKHKAYPNGASNNTYFQIAEGIEITRLVFEGMKAINTTLKQ